VHALDLLECGREIKQQLGETGSVKPIEFIINNSTADRWFVRDLIIIAALESRLTLNPANGPDGEIGMFQLMPATAAECGVTAEQLRDPVYNLRAASCYYEQMLGYSSMDVMAAVAGYNGGYRAAMIVRRYGNLSSVTANYIWKFYRLRSLSVCSEQ